jgi:lipoic acid synthetase
VTRDDLPDGGASHFAGCVQAIKSLDEAPVVEVLVPDFRGCEGPVETAAGSGAEVFAHNVETVPRLYGRVRDRASYTRSLSVLRTAGKAFPDVIVKSGLMVGLGETLGEVKSVIGDLREAGCTIVTVGQYLRPSGKHHPVDRYYEPREFEELREYSEELGLVAVAGPKVRSSYLASTAYMKVRQGGRDADRGHLEIS